MKAIELFAGAGGLGIGISRAGFKPERIVEWEPNCQRTLLANRHASQSDAKRWPLEIERDVRDADFTAHEGKIELVSGGPPCQPFSVGGRHRAQADRRDMFPEAVRAVREAKPRAFIFENVRGLTRASFSSYYEYIKLQMQYPELVAMDDEDWSTHLRRLERHHTSSRAERGLEYRLVAEVLNAADYGVPRNGIGCSSWASGRIRESNGLSPKLRTRRKPFCGSRRTGITSNDIACPRRSGGRTQSA